MSRALCIALHGQVRISTSHSSQLYPRNNGQAGVTLFEEDNCWSYRPSRISAVSFIQSMELLALPMYASKTRMLW